MFDIDLEKLRRELAEEIEEVKKIGRKNIEKAKKFGEPFFTGRIYITDGVRELGYSEDSPELDKIYSRYIECDWGEEEDTDINEKSIEIGYGDIMGVYRLDGHVIWIKTDLNEHTRTTILLPQEW